jgi:ATP-dependent DNA helicase RecG
MFPQAVVRVIRYLGPTRTTGSRQDIEFDERFEGPIPHVIRAARETILRLIPRRRLLSRGGKFIETPIVPEDAWLEGLVNAVVHRSYSLGGDHTRVEIFPNRVEFESPGRFPGLADVRNPLHIARFARNPRISRVCADLSITQELGEGIRRMFDEMQKAGLADPLYRQTAGSVQLVLAATARLDSRIEAELPRGSGDVLRLLQHTDHQLGTGDIASLLGVSRPTTIRRLTALREAGLVDWHGKTAKDPRAFWAVRSAE